MDEVTQQNSALVEENAATAKTLEGQAHAMDERVAGFKLRAAPMAAKPSRPAPVVTVAKMAAKRQAAKPHAGPANRSAKPVVQMRTGHATALKAEPDWTEF